MEKSENENEKNWKNRKFLKSQGIFSGPKWKIGFYFQKSNFSIRPYYFFFDFLFARKNILKKHFFIFFLLCRSEICSRFRKSHLEHRAIKGLPWHCAHSRVPKYTLNTFFGMPFTCLRSQVWYVMKLWGHELQSPLHCAHRIYGEWNVQSRVSIESD